MLHPASQTMGVDIMKKARFHGVIMPRSLNAINASNRPAIAKIPTKRMVATLSTPSRVKVTRRRRFLSSSSGCSKVRAHDSLQK